MAAAAFGLGCRELSAVSSIRNPGAIRPRVKLAATRDDRLHKVGERQCFISECRQRLFPAFPAAQPCTAGSLQVVPAFDEDGNIIIGASRYIRMARFSVREKLPIYPTGLCFALEAFAVGRLRATYGRAWDNSGQWRSASCEVVMMSCSGGRLDMRFER